MISIEQTHNTRQGKITSIDLPHRQRNQQAREALAASHYDPKSILMENKNVISSLPATPFREIAQPMVKGEPLGFEKSFLGMTYVVAATNQGIFDELKPAFEFAHGLTGLKQDQLRGAAQTFLTGMAQKESAGNIDATEIAGMVAATFMDLNARFGFSPHVLETSGMGGDKGFVINGQKTKVINASTLSAIVLSSLDVPVLKHGSYANTSAVGSTDAVEALGINIFQDNFPDIQKLFSDTNFYFSDAHIAKTVHDQSHSPFMRHETINHLIGPMTPPVDKKTRLHKIIGVNEGISPETVAKAYEKLHNKGYQQVGNVAVISGLDGSAPDNIHELPHAQQKPYMMLDEMSPYKTLVSVVKNGEYTGTILLKPEDFGVTLDPNRIQHVNSQRDLLLANGEALAGLGRSNTDYLAMNAALGLFLSEYMDQHDAIDGPEINRRYLREAFQRCKDVLVSGCAAQHLQKIISSSQL